LIAKSAALRLMNLLAPSLLADTEERSAFFLELDEEDADAFRSALHEWFCSRFFLLGALALSADDVSSDFEFVRSTFFVRSVACSWRSTDWGFGFVWGTGREFFDALGFLHCTDAV